MILTKEQLLRIVPKAREALISQYVPHINKAMLEFTIDSEKRTAAFIAQIAHETGAFLWLNELWGPTDQQKKYEPPSKLSERLGNTQAGDGKRFKGRGAIQLTGRGNYDKYGKLLKLDLINTPTLAAEPEAAFRIAGAYWETHRLNELADEGKFEAITRAINGGVNGLTERRKYYDRALEVLAWE